MLRTKDLQRHDRLLYEHVSASDCDSLSEAEYGWASLSRDSVELMVAAPNGHACHSTAPCLHGVVLLSTSMTRPRSGPASKTVVKVGYPMEDFHYGMREFAIYDNNGYHASSSALRLGEKRSDGSGPVFKGARPVRPFLC